ncbi:MAG: endonuclease III [Muribaculaceae bacterium]|nr:endonuclease III [Muribaculaceae bacterium]
MTQDERYREVLERFRREMPQAQTELHYGNPFQLLVAVILSAQCTDKRINMVTPALFEAYPDAPSMAAATHDGIFAYIKSVSYPNNKAKSLLGMARKLADEFGGRVPDDIDALLSLPGVGRKTANVILSVVYDRPAMAVDTHVFRVAERIGLTTRSRGPLETEKKLTSKIPEADIARAHHWLILHGRYVCKARSPQCGDCFLADVCRERQRELVKIKKVLSDGSDSGK